jgi:protein tyrosine/serine phosphatase
MSLLVGVGSYTDPWRPRIWEVVPNEFYRSRLLSPDELKGINRKYGIKTVISLMEDYPTNVLLESEIKTCKELGLNFNKIGIRSAKELFDSKRIKKLMGIYQKEDGPFLVHCKHGSDRAGLASLLYLWRVKKVPFKEAKKQLSIKYGYIKICHRDLNRLVEKLREAKDLDEI